MRNDLTFFTNEEGRTLLDRFNSILKTNTQYFDILVGYFRTSGFYNLYKAMGNIEKIRILAGLNVDSNTIEIINLAESQIAFGQPSAKEAKATFTSNIENEFSKSEDSLEIEEGVKTFIAWLKTNKVEMRIYTEAPIHAKVYIVRKDESKSPDYMGSVITGSSNFSLAGLKNNLEFNVELKDSRDVDFALDKFEELWKRSVDIKDEYINTIHNKTWIKSDITPYELYLKTIYEFFKEEINSDKEALIDQILPSGYMKLQYQIDAVTQAKKILEAYNGVFISDVVGLGKTYICAMLAKSLKRGYNKLIICPPVLVDYWNSVMKEFDVVADVKSLGILDRILEDEKNLSRYEYIFIDEAHRFRNSDTESFKILHQICYNKKVILISATPINNYSSDIENQIYLFQPKHKSNIMPNEKNLEGFFARLNTKLKKYDRGTPEYNVQMRKNSEVIRDRLLRHIMIRRTRKEIMDFYKEDMDKQGLKFPNVGTPEKIIYTFDKFTNDVFKETMRIIKNLDYARYTPLLYLEDNKQFASMLVSQRNMSGFMKSVLVKRLESSFYAFKKTLSRFIESYERFIGMCKSGDIYISKKINVYDLLDNGDDDKLAELERQERVQHFKIDRFRADFIPSLERDLGMLKRLKSYWDQIDKDPKLEQFITELKNNKILKNTKMIIFTESKETAQYLEVNLKSMFGSRLISFSGESSEYLKRDIEYSFNPRYKDSGKDKYDVLITTDILAEGINLHRANVLINYDLPWNPTRMMQRGGRINRVGTEYDRIFMFNFFPTSQTDAHLPLKDRIIEKLQAFHDTLGEDFKYLSEEERVTSHKLYGDLTESLDEDEEGTNPELAYLTEIRKIRDNDIELFERIKHIPIKAKTGKTSNRITDKATVTFLRKGGLKSFFKTERHSTEEITFIEAASLMKAKKKDESISVNEMYFKHLEKNKRAFDNRLDIDEEVATGKATISGNDLKMIKLLKALSKCRKFTDNEELLVAKMIELWENGQIPQGLTKDILKSVKNIEDELEAFSTIRSGIPERYFSPKEQDYRASPDIKQVILSCYMENGGK